MRIRESTTMCKAELAWRLPPRFSRWRLVLPDEAGMGHAPQSIAKLASDVNRSGSSGDNVSMERHQRRCLRRHHFVWLTTALSSTKMAKHIRTEVGPGSFDYSIDEASVTAEAQLDGIYLTRTTVAKDDASAAAVVGYYKNLANIERVFRSMKSIDIGVRPVRHYIEDQVRAHVLSYVLNAHLLHLARERLSELTFRDEEPPLPSSPVAKKIVSQSAKTKAASKINAEGAEVIGLRCLLNELDMLTRTTCSVKGTDVSFNKTTTPTSTQRRAFELIGAKIPA